jgi:tetratricopeptide (TPR) repeat protein
MTPGADRIPDDGPERDDGPAEAAERPAADGVPAGDDPGEPGDGPAEPEHDPGEPGDGPAEPEHDPADGGDPAGERRAGDDPAAPDPAPNGPPAARRLARLHLRMGSLALARAELESLAGRGALDELALLDLAEARWRTGDTAGAGEAAHAALERGVEDPLAYAIAAEAAATLGRPAEARRLAGLAMEGRTGSLDELFAGMPRSQAWPGEAGPDGVALLAAAGRRARTGSGEDPSPASAAAAEAFAGGRAALGSGDTATAGLRLGVAIRLEPAYAQSVLAVIGDRAGDPYLALVAGDALRMLGREPEALDAFDRARGRPRGSDGAEAPVASEAPEPWPGDEDA